MTARMAKAWLSYGCTKQTLNPNLVALWGTPQGVWPLGQPSAPHMAPLGMAPSGNECHTHASHYHTCEAYKWEGQVGESFNVQG